MIGNTLLLSYTPTRIVSLVPSQTELLYDLGLNNEVVGITKFCVHPKKWHSSKKRVGGTKSLHIDIVKGLQPDLIIANKEENTKEQIEELSSQFPVFVSDIQTVEDALSMINEVGSLTGKTKEAATMASDIENGFTRFKKAATPRRVAYFIWQKPWMCAGGDTFISDVISKIGWQNALADQSRYPEITEEALKELNPELVLLSSEPFPFKEAQAAEIKKILPKATIKLVDGEMFSWYGSRMKKALGYFEQLIR